MTEGERRRDVFSEVCWWAKHTNEKIRVDRGRRRRRKKKRWRKKSRI